jgi:ABC-type glycerol-3-phosphate transport system substrate-binding protein
VHRQVPAVLLALVVALAGCSGVTSPCTTTDAITTADATTADSETTTVTSTGPTTTDAPIRLAPGVAKGA